MEESEASSLRHWIAVPDFCTALNVASGQQMLTQSVGVCEATHGDAVSASHHPPVAECRQGWSAHPAVRASWPGLTLCVLQSRLLPGGLPAAFVFRDSLIHDRVSYIQWLSYVLILEIGRKGCLCTFIFPEETSEFWQRIKMSSLYVYCYFIFVSSIFSVFSSKWSLIYVYTCVCTYVRTYVCMDGCTYMYMYFSGKTLLCSLG